LTAATYGDLQNLEEIKGKTKYKVLHARVAKRSMITKQTTVVLSVEPHLFTVNLPSMLVSFPYYERSWPFDTDCRQTVAYRSRPRDMLIKFKQSKLHNVVPAVGIDLLGTLLAARFKVCRRLINELALSYVERSSCELVINNSEPV
jgi:hypothetical protein